eukprot:13646414-Alexandrium_andersonii.AAC.1
MCRAHAPGGPGTKGGPKARTELKRITRCRVVALSLTRARARAADGLCPHAQARSKESPENHQR